MAWTQGFFPGLLWLLVERERLVPGFLPSAYSVEDLEEMARTWQQGFRQHARKAINHDQGFRFATSFGRDFKLTGEESNKEVLIEAADSLWDRYDPKVRSASAIWLRRIPRHAPLGTLRAPADSRSAASARGTR